MRAVVKGQAALVFAANLGAGNGSPARLERPLVARLSLAFFVNLAREANPFLHMRGNRPLTYAFFRHEGAAIATPVHIRRSS